MIAPPDYDREEKAARLLNAEELRNDINSPSVANKIASWATRNSLEPEFVRFKVLTDDTFALHFAKDPGRQSLHQKVAARHIQKAIPLVEDFKSLSASGPDAEYVVNGMVVNGATWRTIRGEGKSIDFRWSLIRGGKTFRVYETHKHTKRRGRQPGQSTRRCAPVPGSVPTLCEPKRSVRSHLRRTVLFAYRRKEPQPSW
mgnify:CR=1 FL=1